MNIPVSSSLIEVPPSLILSDGFELTDGQIIPSETISSSFLPEVNSVELFIYDFNKTLLEGEYQFNDWTITENSDTQNLNGTDVIQLNPSKDLYDRGYDTGNLYAIYNFVNYEASSSNTNLYYISDISSDRTEIRLKSNFISNEDIKLGFLDLKAKIDNADYFDEFYISSVMPNGNSYNIGVNLQLEESTPPPSLSIEGGKVPSPEASILIKLYDALPENLSVKDQVYIATKVAESKAYQVNFEKPPFIVDDAIYLQGPNYNLEIKDFVNNSTELKNENQLLTTNSTQSSNNLSNILNRKGVTITPNYSYDTFNEFVNFSSAKSRIENFYYKVGQIEGYNNDITTLNAITGSTSSSLSVSASKASLESSINTIIKNFDGYEYYLYYESGSSAYPKVSGSLFPYELQSTSSVEVLEWLGSDVENNQYYGGILLSASFYDYDNQNWLWWTIPEFIKNDTENDNYIEFSSMVGQHFDEIWLYTKAVTEKLNTTNELDKGVPLGIAQDVIKSFGYDSLTNNYNDQNNFIGLTGENSGSYVPPTGSELIENYIAINGGTVTNYWNPFYALSGYVVQPLETPGFPWSIDKVSKEIYKRLYHNMSYLVKKKGTIAGLRQLINIWGIPDTILRISEFGGKNKDNTDDYDYWYNRYSYAFSPIANQHQASASAVIPWMPLERNRIADSEYIVPDSFQFRFKTTGYPSSSMAGEFFTQSLAVKKSDGDDTSTEFDLGISLFYTGSVTGSYSGSGNDIYRDWGLMRFYISGAAAEGGTVVSDDVYLPFFNKGWWSVMLQRDQHVSASDHTNDTTYTLYVKNKIYNGNDGNNIGFEGSASVFITGSTSSSINESWNKFGTGSYDGIYLGGFVSGSTIGGITTNESGKIFSGSLQEFRYYSNDIPETVFNDFVMNPESIEGNNITGSESSFDIVNFRAPLGNELESFFTASSTSSYTESIESLHPAVSALASELITGSFVNPDGNVTSSNYYIQYYDNTDLRTYSIYNVESYFLDQPAIGIRNRISNKIQIDDADDYGTVLSNQISIEQDYEISRSYTEDITSLEVSFSPQDNINDDVIQSFGFGVVSDALADPRFISESVDHYPQLRNTAEYYFQKYTEGNIYDYIRLIKYIDNSLFKAIKNYVPARTSVSTGIVIKQHMLERNRYSPPSITKDTPLAITPETGSVDQGTPAQGFNSPIYFEDIQVSASLNTNTVEGGTGGVVESLNYYGPATTNPATGNPGSASFGETSITQSYSSSTPTVKGLVEEVISTQDEFYDGEYSGSEFAATTQSLFDNPYEIFEGVSTFYNVEITSSEYETYNIDLLTITGSNYNTLLDQVEQYLDLDTLPINTGLIAIQEIFKPAFGINPAYSQSAIVELVLPMKIPGTFTQGISQSILLNDSEQPQPLEEWPYPNTIAPLTTNYPNGWDFNKSAPFFTMEITGSTGDYTFGDNLFNLKKFQYFSSTAATPIGRVETTDSVGTKCVKLRYPQTISPGKGNYSSTSRTVIYNDLVPSGPGPNYPPTLSVSMVVGAFQEGRDNALNAFNSSPIGSGTASFTFYPVTFGDEQNNVTTTPYPERREWYPNIISFNYTSIDPESGDPVDNSETLTNDPDYTVDLNFNGDTLEPDSYGLSGSVFRRSLVNYDIIANDQAGTGPTSIIYGTGLGSRPNSGSSTFELISSESIFFPFSPLLPAEFNFDLSIYNATFNNYNDNRDNTFLQDVDYSTDGITPVNIGPIRSGSATKAQTPDSNYTARRVIYPRYEGSRLQSLNYNFYTPPVYLSGSSFFLKKPKTPETFLNGDTGSWGGDDSYGNTAVIDKNPIYFAHFKNSKENYEYWDTYTFRIDALIEVPFEELKEKERIKEIPNIIKLDGSGDNLFAVNSTFEQGRKAIVSYQTPIKGNIDYTALAVGDNEIYQGALEYNFINGTETSETNYITTQSFYTASWFELINSSSNDLDSNIYLFSGSNNGRDYWLETGSSVGNDTGEIFLKGGNSFISCSFGRGTNENGVWYWIGPSLALLHTFNKRIEGKHTSSADFDNIDTSGFFDVLTGSIGYPSGSKFNIRDNENYSRMNVFGSTLQRYEDFRERFIIEPGDEIRVTYNSQFISGSTVKIIPNYVTQDFTVVDVPFNEDSSSIGGFLITGSGYLVVAAPETGSVFDKLVVTPDPSTLETPIPSGSIFNYTIRRRVNADDRVIVFQTAPTGSQGNLTTSGEGYLIPNDLSPIQKRNVQILISQLKGKNTFRDDTNFDVS